MSFIYWINKRTQWRLQKGLAFLQAETIQVILTDHLQPFSIILEETGDI